MVIDSDDGSPSRRTPILEVPDNDNPSPENIPEVRPPASPSSNVLDIATGYHLPFWGWSDPLIKFAQKLSSDHIPCGVHESLADHKWSVAIQEEMEALNRNRTWDLVPLLAGKNLWGVSGYSQLNTKQMDPLKDTRQG